MSEGVESEERRECARASVGAKVMVSWACCEGAHVTVVKAERPLDRVHLLTRESDEDRRKTRRPADEVEEDEARRDWLRWYHSASRRRRRLCRKGGEQFEAMSLAAEKLVRHPSASTSSLVLKVRLAPLPIPTHPRCTTSPPQSSRSPPRRR